MRQLLPSPVDDVDVYEACRPPEGEASWVRLNMLTSLDGAVTGDDGRAGSLQGEGDLLAFRALRAHADVILVGAGTVRAEGYGPPRTPKAFAEQRAADGRPDPPALAIVSRSLDLDPAAKVFQGGGGPVVVVTGAAGLPDRRDALAAVADLIVAGEVDVDLGLALAAFRDRGWHHVLSEGGPTLNASLLPHVDELCLTLAPRIVGDASLRLVHGPLDVQYYELDAALEHDGELILRYRRSRPGSASADGSAGGAPAASATRAARSPGATEVARSEEA